MTESTRGRRNPRTADTIEAHGFEVAPSLRFDDLARVAFLDPSGATRGGVVRVRPYAGSAPGAVVELTSLTRTPHGLLRAVDSTHAPGATARSGQGTFVAPETPVPSADYRLLVEVVESLPDRGRLLDAVLASESSRSGQGAGSALVDALRLRELDRVGLDVALPLLAAVASGAPLEWVLRRDLP